MYLLDSRVESDIFRVVVELRGSRVDLEGLLFPLQVTLELMARRTTASKVRVYPVQLLTQLLLPGTNRLNLAEQGLFSSVVDEVDA